MSRSTKLMMIAIERDVDHPDQPLCAHVRWGSGAGDDVRISARTPFDMAWFLTHEIVKAFRR